MKIVLEEGQTSICKDYGGEQLEAEKCAMRQWEGACRMQSG